MKKIAVWILRFFLVAIGVVAYSIMCFPLILWVLLILGIHV